MRATLRSPAVLRQLLKLTRLETLELRFSRRDRTMALRSVDASTVVFFSLLVGDFETFEFDSEAGGGGEDELVVAVSAKPLLAAMAGSKQHGAVTLRTQEPDHLVVEVAGSGARSALFASHVLQQLCVVGEPIAPDRFPTHETYATRAIVLASLVAELAKALEGKNAADSVTVASSADASALDFCVTTDQMRSTLRLQLLHQPDMALRVVEPTVCRVSRRLLQQVFAFAAVPGCSKVMLWYAQWVWLRFC